MRALAIAGVALLAGASPPRIALVPNAMLFESVRDGLLGTGWTSCANPGFGCRPQGTISATSDGGRTWHVVVRTPRPVVSLRDDRATMDDGTTLVTADGGRHWHLGRAGAAPSLPCALGFTAPPDQAVFSPAGEEWALCVGQPSAGSQGKAVYERTAGGWQKLAWTAGPGGAYPGRGSGGISDYGYPEGMAMADDGFGLIWESRGTLYVTRDGGHHWTGEPTVAEPEVDFGFAGATLDGGVGYVILGKGGGAHRRLLETTNEGRTWRVVHRWS